MGLPAALAFMVQLIHFLVLSFLNSRKSPFTNLLEYFCFDERAEQFLIM